MIMEKDEEENNPYPYPLRDLRAAERNYCIQVGHELYVLDNTMVFSADTIKDVEQAALSEILDMLKNGTEDEKNDARFYIANFHVHAIRIH